MWKNIFIIFRQSLFLFLNLFRVPQGIVVSTEPHLSKAHLYKNSLHPNMGYISHPPCASCFILTETPSFLFEQMASQYRAHCFSLKITPSRGNCSTTAVLWSSTICIAIEKIFHLKFQLKMIKLCFSKDHLMPVGKRPSLYINVFNYH